MNKKLLYLLLFCTFKVFAQSTNEAASEYSVIENKNIEKVITYWEEVWSKHNLQAVEDFYHPQAKHGKNFSIEKFKRNVSSFRETFPDFTVIVDDIFAVKDRVITRVTYIGTHTGKILFGQEPLSKEIKVPGIDVFTIKDGKCVEHQHVADHLDLVLQMGMILTPVNNDSIAVVRLLRDSYKTFGNWDIDNFTGSCTDNYLLIENGEIWDMEKTLQYFSENSHRKITREDYFDFKDIRIYDQTAYAVYTLKSDIKENGEQRIKTWNESAAFRKINGEWKIELLHSTPLVSE